MAIKMFQLRKRLLYKSEDHDHGDDQADNDGKTKSGGRRYKSTVQPLAATVANISPLRTPRSVTIASQTASPDHGQLSTVSAPTRSYKRLGTSSPLSSVKRRRTNLPSHAPSPIMASVAVASRSSPLHLSTRPTIPASHSSPKDTKTPSKIGYALPKSVFEDIDDGQAESQHSPICMADFTQAHDALTKKQHSMSKLLDMLATNLHDSLQASETKINTLRNKEPSLDKPAKHVAQLEITHEECQDAQAMMAKGHGVQHKLRAAQSNLERSRIQLKAAQDEMTQVKTAYHNWRAGIVAETEKATTIRESLQLVKRHKKHYAFLETLVRGGPLMTEKLVGVAKDAGLKFETWLSEKEI
ncbi:hypothetical protein NXS19_012959 [Fusarium pseudograminearum]|nr:hypothetical protein NXS19_012959 [Fusarium pseudograminearum]